MVSPVQSLADTLVLGALLEEVRARCGTYELLDHWKQGEFHHDLVIRIPAGDEDLGPILVIATNCNGGVKEVLSFRSIPDRRALWHWRCPSVPDFFGTLPPLVGRAVTHHWFDPCELRSEVSPRESFDDTADAATALDAPPRRNIEQKWSCDSLGAVLARALRLGAEDHGVLVQTDTFFDVPSGRLKLREFEDGNGELISYRRPNEAKARASDYCIYPADDPGALRATLAHVPGVLAVVKKHRHLLIVDHTRIHLDTVEGLGTYVELETVVVDPTDAQARVEFDSIASALELDEARSVAVAYVDLLVRRSQP